MKKGICYVVGAGEVTGRGLSPQPGDILIAADGGHDRLLRLGLRPHLLVGDMDSRQQSAPGIPQMRFPVRKDDTDLALAVRAGKALGYRRFRLYGASGAPRHDHFLAALQLMAGMSQEGLSVQLVAPRFDVYALTNSLKLLPAQPGNTVSVFSAGNRSLGVTLRGLAYTADNLTLYNSRALGVSNAATGRVALVGVQQGTLLVYVQR